MENFIQTLEVAEKKLAEAEGLISLFPESKVAVLVGQASTLSEKLLQSKAILLSKKEYLLGQLLRLIPHLGKFYPQEGLRFALSQGETEVTVFFERNLRFSIVGIGPIRYFRLEKDHPTYSYKELAKSILFWPFVKVLLEFYISTMDDVSKTSSADAEELTAILAEFQRLEARL